MSLAFLLQLVMKLRRSPSWKVKSEGWAKKKLRRWNPLINFYRFFFLQTLIERREMLVCLPQLTHTSLIERRFMFARWIKGKNEFIGHSPQNNVPLLTFFSQSFFFLVPSFRIYIKNDTKKSDTSQRNNKKNDKDNIPSKPRWRVRGDR